MTVAVSNRAGNQYDLMIACGAGTGPGTGVACANYPFNFLYLNCTEGQPTTPPYPTSATCTNFPTPPSAGSYVAYLTTWPAGTANLAHVPITAVGGSVNISGVTLTPNTVNVGFSGTVGLLATTCSTTCPGGATYTLPTTAVTGCTAAHIADNGSFAISAANLNTATPLSAARVYNVGVVDTMPNAGNSGNCWPTPVTITSAGQQITVNGQSAGAVVGAGANMTVAVSGGPGTGQTVSSFVSVCNGAFNSADCDGAYSWDYLGAPCSHTQPGSVQNSASCTLIAPSAAGNYTAAWFPTSGNYTALASATFAVPSIQSVAVAPSSFTVGNPFSGTLTTTCSVACPASPIYSFTTNATACPTNNNNFFSLSGSTLSTNTTLTNPQTYYACLSVAMNGASNSGAAFSVAGVGNSGTAAGCLPDIPCPPCPRNCTWTLVYNDDFSDGHVMNRATTYTYYPTGCNGLQCQWLYWDGMWWVESDGGKDSNSVGGTFECNGTIGNVMLSSGGGYIQLVPNSASVGAFETGKADSYTCNIIPGHPFRSRADGTNPPMLFQYVSQVSPAPGVAGHGLVTGSLLEGGSFCTPPGPSFEGQFTEVRGGTGGYPELEGNYAFGCPNVWASTLWNWSDGSWHVLAQLLDPGQDASHQGGYGFYFDDMTNASFFTNTEQCAGPSSTGTCFPTLAIPLWEFYVGSCCWPSDDDNSVPSGFFKIQKARMYVAGPVSCNNTIGSPGSNSYSCQ